ncbi:MAG: LytTR family DNA-binding domain-containing protein [Candidatus Metalachnospira sp.]|nr:LytTR family DNA-binding domain-containing protein [Candidatus Metalachnospira sp.]
MLRIAICDDLPEQLTKIKTTTEQFFRAYQDESIKIFTYGNPLIFLESLDKVGGFDIVLLDVCMPGIDGTQVAGEIRRRKDKSEIIFLTTSDEFAVEAFALKAAHYLVKPFTQAQFGEAMDRAMAHFIVRQAQKVVLRLIGGGTRVLELNEILWIESHNHSQTIFLKDGDSEEARKSLSQLFAELEKLSPGQFVSPYKGYIVNQKAIRTVEPKGIIMRTGQTIPLARGTFREFSDRYFTYLFPKGGMV